MVSNDESSTTTIVNMTYGTNKEAFPHLPTMQQQDDMDLTRNEAYTPTNIPVEPNQCYDTPNQSHEEEEYYDYVQQ